MSAAAGTFGAVAIALYAGHHVGDYWVQTHHQSMHKGDAGPDGAWQCFLHVWSYLATQTLTLAIVVAVLDFELSNLGVISALLVSGVTHYMADRREHGLMFWLIQRMPWKRGFLAFGAPRKVNINVASTPCTHATMIPVDNPSLGTGAWALDQSWHIFWGVFVAALLVVAL